MVYKKTKKEESPTNVFQIIVLILAIMTLTSVLSYREHIQQQKQIYAIAADKSEILKTKILKTVSDLKTIVSSLLLTIDQEGVDNFTLSSLERFDEFVRQKLRYSNIEGLGVAFKHGMKKTNSSGMSYLDYSAEISIATRYTDRDTLLGVDLFGIPSWKDALEQTSKFDTFVLHTPSLAAANASAILTNISILHPLQQNAANTKSGWVFLTIKEDALSRDISNALKGITFTIIDETVGNREHIFRQKGSADGPVLATHEIAFGVAGKRLRVVFEFSDLAFENYKVDSLERIVFESLGFSILLLGAVFWGFLRMQKTFQHKSEEVNAHIEEKKALYDINAQLQEEVRDSESRLANNIILQEAIINHSGYAIISTDPNGVITEFNPAAEALLGYNKQELVNKSTPAIFHIEQEVVARAFELSEELGYTIEPGFDCFVEKVKHGGVDSKQWTYVTKADAQLQVQLTITSLRDSAGSLIGYLGIAHDLTARLELEKSLKNTEKMAVEANKAKSRFLANMSHEIRTPMNGIYGSLQVLKSEALSEQGKHLLQNAEYSVNALMTIINDILDLSKIESGKLVLENRAFNFEHMLERLNSDFRPSASQKGIALNIESKIKYPNRVGDEIRIRQILLNLVTNALKFTETGFINLEVDLTPDSEFVAIKVSDSGIGMSDDMLQKLFKPFEQADPSITRKFGGTGLGLTITKELVECMNGAIKVESQEHKGTQITVILSLPVATEAVVTKTLERVDSTILKETVVLVAEDNPINQTVIKAMLSPVVAKLVLVDNGLEAVNILDTFKPDLVLLDIQMPKMDGLEACKNIKKGHAQLPLIALTANAFDEDKKKYRDVGFDGYVSKPIDKSLLLKEIIKFIVRK